MRLVEVPIRDCGKVAHRQKYFLQVVSKNFSTIDIWKKVEPLLRSIYALEFSPVIFVAVTPLIRCILKTSYSSQNKKWSHRIGLDWSRRWFRNTDGEYFAISTGILSCSFMNNLLRILRRTLNLFPSMTMVENLRITVDVSHETVCRHIFMFLL